MSNPSQTHIQEPSRDAWLVSGSTAQVCAAVITDAYAYGCHRLDLKQEFNEHEVEGVTRFDPPSLLGATVQARFDGVNEEEDNILFHMSSWENETCRVIAIDFSRTHVKSRRPFMCAGAWLYTVEFEDGEIWDKIELGDIRRSVR